MALRRTASALLVALAVVLFGGPAAADESCVINPVDGTIDCVEGGRGTDPPPDPDPGDDDPALRYLYTRTVATGDCFYWSATPGGLDAWDPADDAAVIAITTSIDECVTLVSDPTTLAWVLFRSWELDPPDPSVTPSEAGITGLPSHVASLVPVTIVHDELLPDGRTLRVRARVTALVVDWGDGAITNHHPEAATGYPDGSASHAYTVKTCPPEYREDHPSGGLCHPTLEAYPITLTYVWTGEFDVGSGWTALGTLDRSSALTYDVNEAVGIKTS